MRQACKRLACVWLAVVIIPWAHCAPLPGEAHAPQTPGQAPPQGRGNFTIDKVWMRLETQDSETLQRGQTPLIASSDMPLAADRHEGRPGRRSKHAVDELPTTATPSLQEEVEQRATVVPLTRDDGVNAPSAGALQEDAQEQAGRGFTQWASETKAKDVTPGGKGFVPPPTDAAPNLCVVQRETRQFNLQKSNPESHALDAVPDAGASRIPLVESMIRDQILPMMAINRAICEWDPHCRYFDISSLPGFAAYPPWWAKVAIILDALQQQLRLQSADGTRRGHVDDEERVSSDGDWMGDARCGMVLWIDSDAVLHFYDRPPSEFFTERMLSRNGTQTHFLIGHDVASSHTDLYKAINAGVFLTRVSVQGLNIVRAWFDVYADTVMQFWHREPGTNNWKCLQPGKPKRYTKMTEIVNLRSSHKAAAACPWSGIFFEQGAFKFLVLPKFTDDVSLVAKNQLDNSMCALDTAIRYGLPIRYGTDHFFDFSHYEGVRHFANEQAKRYCMRGYLDLLPTHHPLQPTKLNSA